MDGVVSFARSDRAEAAWHPDVGTTMAPEPAPSAILHVVEAALYVDDLDTAEAFYGEVLNLERIGREDGRHVFFRAGDAVVLLFIADATLKGDRLPSHGTRGPGHLALGIAAESYEAWRGRLIDRGVAITFEEHWPRGGRSLYFHDPAGNVLELITPGVWGLPSGW